MESIGVWWLWVIFFCIVALILGVDVKLGALKYHKVSLKEACAWTIVCIFSAVSFGALIWMYGLHVATPAIANQKTLEFYTGFTIEQSLSIDNLFVFITIFNYFKVDAHYQRRVLMFGIWGAVVLRFIMIMLGTWLVETIHWILYVFGAFLIFTAIKILSQSEEADLEKNYIIIFAKKYLRVTKEFHGEKFFVKKHNINYVTPLFIVLLLIEGSDVIFAIDSIPAIFSVTQDFFIVFTSNIFAILGLRSMYFILVDFADRFHLMKYGIATMLAIVGVKMLISPWFTLPIGTTLLLVLTILVLSIILGFFIKPKKEKYS